MFFSGSFFTLHIQIYNIQKTNLTILLRFLPIPSTSPVLAEGVQVHRHAKRARVQPEGAPNYRSRLPGPAGHRDLDTGPPGAHVTAAVPFHRGVLHVRR